MSDDRRPEVDDGEDRRSFQTALGASNETMTRLDVYRGLLADWSVRFNLIGPSVLADFWRRHALDSAQLVAISHGALRWSDLGSGAGFPGVVIAVLLQGRAGAKVHLVESVAKRSGFLRHVAETLDLPVVVHNARAESLALDVDVVTARACAPLPRLLEFAAPHMRGRAMGLFLKGRDVESELTAARVHWRLDVELLPSLSDASGRILKVTRLARA